MRGGKTFGAKQWGQDDGVETSAVVVEFVDGDSRWRYVDDAASRLFCNAFANHEALSSDGRLLNVG